MKTLNLIAVFASLSFGVAHALTISGKVPVGVEKVWVAYQLVATKKFPFKCTYLNVLGPIFNGDRRGWIVNRINAFGESLVDEAGNYSVKIDYSKLAKSICRYEVASLTVNIAPNPKAQINLDTDPNATETIFNFYITRPIDSSYHAAEANIQNENSFVVNFK